MAARPAALDRRRLTLSLGPPLVSICIPLRDGEQWIGDAVDSALAQTYENVEVLVVDDGSSDGSIEVVQRRAEADARVRLEVNAERLGAVANHDRCIALARGDLLKFLHHDDVLAPACVARMAEIFERTPEVGLVFCRREVVLEDADDPAAVAWKEEFGELHTSFASLRRVNQGRDLLAQYVPALGHGQYRNWIGEPSAVMLRRSCIDRVGDFHDRMHQSWDLELWLRVMAVADVGFVDAPLVRFRHHSESLTAANARRHAEWLDLLWLYEGLLAEPALADHHPLIRTFRRRQLVKAARQLVARVLRGDLGVGAVAPYLAHRARGAIGAVPAFAG